MGTESQKYRAQLFQVSGLACFTPIGKTFMDLPNIGIGHMNLKFIIYLLLSVFLIYMGIILIVRGFEVLEGNK